MTSAHSPLPVFEEDSQTITGIRTPTRIQNVATVTMYKLTNEEIIARRAEVIKRCNTYPELLAALKVFLGHDERFLVSVGGNPNAVDEMLDGCRTLLKQLNEDKP